MVQKYLLPSKSPINVNNGDNSELLLSDGAGPKNEQIGEAGTNDAGAQHAGIGQKSNKSPLIKKQEEIKKNIAGFKDTEVTQY